MAAYDELGTTYGRTRVPDPRIQALIDRALGDAATVINVGAGTGSYEPADRKVLAVEPSAVMIAQRAPGAAPCVQASAEALPFDDASFDAALAILTVHHWSDLERGIGELRRVARRRIVILTWDAEFGDEFWLTRDYVPASISLDKQRFPAIDRLAALLGPGTVVEPVPVPHDCSDGFCGAFWRRPEAYLDPEVRAGISNLRQLEEQLTDGLARLRRDLASGSWQARNAHLLGADASDVGYRLVRTR
jgi:SAM-dependent methyltransferase